MSKGKIIVLEGLDGCGKSTQLELAQETLAAVGMPCRAVSFPNYGSPSGEIITQYLHGEIPCDGRNGAYAASAFYAADRYISFVTDWKRDYDGGEVILAGRYTTSNAIYQMTKLPDDEKDAFLEWLWDYEYNKLGLPEPDLVLFLDMPVEVSQKLLSKRYEGDETQKDIHEANLTFMRKCRESALYAAERCGWSIIPCSENCEPLSIEKIHTEIEKRIKEMIRNDK
jgi:dTMP kinase